MLDPRTPVLVGVGMVMDRSDDPTACDEPSALMVRAAEAALGDTSAPELRDSIGAVAAMGSMARYSDPAQLVVDAMGLTPDADRLRADPGSLQQKVINRACRQIADGIDAVLIVGAEAKWRETRAAIPGVEVAVTEQPPEAQPHTAWTVGAEVLHPLELSNRVYEAVQQYALMEFALARHRDTPLTEHMVAVAELMSRQSAPAVDNPHAWHRELFAAERIATAGPANRMVSWPYAKWHNSQWNVNQGVALILCAAEVAQSLGVPRDNWIFLRGGAESNHIQPVTVRPEIHRAPWVKANVDAACALAGLTIDDMDALELYSCFPVAVQIQAEAMGIDLDERLHTISGGMTFAGGPFNSWALHATAMMAQHLRGGPGQHGVVTSISGMVTKHGTGIWSTEPDGGGLRLADVTADMADLAQLPTVADHRGEADLVAATVAHDRSGPTRAIALAEHDGVRILATSVAPDVMTQIMHAPDCIHFVTVTEEGFHL